MPANVDRGALETFRQKAREWLAANLPRFLEAWPEQPFNPHCLSLRSAWETHVCRSGWSGFCWPEQYGGKALSQDYHVVWLEEYARAGCPAPANGIGHGIMGNTLLHYGNDEQKARFLPPLLRNEHIWCQGYSEPQSGSDLAGLRSTARRSGESYRLKGHKIWTSQAHIADWCFVLARTDPESVRHRGISFLLVDMKSPGVRVEPIRQITGDAEFCEVFFDDVEVPVENRLGEEGGGWRMAMAAANIERGTYFVPRLVTLKEEMRKLWRLAAEKCGSADLSSAPDWRKRLGRIATRSNSLSLLAEQTLRRGLAGQPDGPESSYTKLLFSETQQELYECALELLGDRVRLGPEGDFSRVETNWIRPYEFTKCMTIAGGTSEIHRNIIAERLLGLPR